MHHLSDKDPEARTAECSVCGPVEIRKAGGKYWQCAVAKREQHRRWMEANPDKVAANRRGRSLHQLTQRDYDTRRAVCVLCGPVEMVPFARGFACGNRARQIRGGHQQPSPQLRCDVCDAMGERTWLRTDGSCPRCERIEELSVAAGLRELESRRTPAGEEWFGFHQDVGDQGVPDYESAVPGWRTIGSRRPWREVA